MDERLVSSRRQALGLVSLAAAGVVIGAPAVSAAAPSVSRRPKDAALARAMRLYGGELGGKKGGR